MFQQVARMAAAFQRASAGSASSLRGAAAAPSAAAAGAAEARASFARAYSSFRNAAQQQFKQHTRKQQFSWQQSSSSTGASGGAQQAQWREQFARFYSTFRAGAYKHGERVRSAGARSRRLFSSYASRMGEKYSWYLEEHPFKTQMVTSGILGGAADVTTQWLEHGWQAAEGKEVKAWDWRRLAAVTAFGVVGMGPMGHVWYIALDKFTHAFCRTQTSMVVAKVCGDTFVFGPVCLWLFFASVSVMEGTPWETIRRKLWRDFVPTYIIDYSFWPIVQGLNFQFVPVRHQLLAVNTVCFFDDIFLTYVQHNELPRLFRLVEEWWEGFYERNLLAPGEKMEDIFFEDEDD